MLSYLQDRAGERKRRLFLAALCRRYWHLLDDPRSRRAVEASEEYADAQIGISELEAALAAAGPSEDRSYTANWARWLGGDMQTAYHRAIAAHAAWSAAGGYIYAGESFQHAVSSERERQQFHLAHGPLLREVFGNPFRPSRIDADWLQWNGSTVVALARSSYEQAQFDAMPILADALEEAGCTEKDILRHCRQQGQHCRGCWVIDLLLAKE
jgi:hypothetical protein